MVVIRVQYKCARNWKDGYEAGSEIDYCVM